MPLDIGVGLLLGIVLSSLTNLNYGFCLGLGVIATLLPDLDFIWLAIRVKGIPHGGHGNHRDGLHYPLLFIPVIGIIGWIIQPAIGLVFALGALAHFLHDSIGIGWGIKWLFPFKENSYLFLYQAGVPTTKDMPKRKFYSWNNNERQEAMKKYSDPEWVRHIYFQLHPFSIVEYLIFILGIFIAATHQ